MTDFNDLFQAEGPHAVNQIIDASIASPPKTAADGATAVRVAALTCVDPIECKREKKAAAKTLAVYVGDREKAVRERKRLVNDKRKVGTKPTFKNSQAGPGHSYRESSDGIYEIKVTKKGKVTQELLTNFCARIVADAVQDDGLQEIRFYAMTTHVYGRDDSFKISASEFAAMGWVSTRLGGLFQLGLGPAVKDKVRLAIQKFSLEMEIRHTYGHTGWRAINGTMAYLHAGGARGSNGPLSGVEVKLPVKLANYGLPNPPGGDALVEAVAQSLRLLDLASDQVTIPLLATVYRGPAGVRLATYVLTTFVGIIPGTAVFSSAGAGLGTVLDQGKGISIGSILTPQIVLALCGLALAAIPLRKRFAA